MHMQPVPVEAIRDEIGSPYRDLALGSRAEDHPLLYRVLANHPALLSAWLDFAWTLRQVPGLSRGLRELVILRVGRRLRAGYCAAAHEAMALDHGVTAAQIGALSQWRESDLFDANERLALQFADEMLDYRMDPALFSTVLERFGPQETEELVLTIGFYQMVASVTVALALPESAISEGPRVAI